jgi:hypothetical protein
MLTDHSSNLKSLQAQCLLAPSKLKADTSQCTWIEATNNCTQSSPPKDFVFIILVSLITIILSVPITMALNFLLENYASVCPSTGDGSADILELSAEVEVEVDIENSLKATEIPRKVAHSDFGKLIKNPTGGSRTSVFATTGTEFCTVELYSVTLDTVLADCLYRTFLS